MTIIPLDSIDDARLLPFQQLRTRRPSDEHFIVEGQWLVERLVASSYQVRSIVVDARRCDELIEKLPDVLTVYRLPAGVVHELVGFQFHRGVLACGERPAALSTFDDGMFSQQRWTAVACIGVADQQNLGGIMRNCAAFGVETVFIGPGCGDYLGRRTLRVSMGAAFQLNVLSLPDLGQALNSLREQFQADIVASVVDDSAQILSATVPAHRTVLLLGGEGYGLSDDWITASDRLLTIPIHASTDSLNVAVASGIILHWLRQCASG